MPEVSEQEGVAANNASSSSRPPSVAQDNVNLHHAQQNHNMYYDYELQQWVNNADQAGQRFNSGPGIHNEFIFNTILYLYSFFPP